jgi:hypothetical protein
MSRLSSCCAALLLSVAATAACGGKTAAPAPTGNVGGDPTPTETGGDPTPFDKANVRARLELMVVPECGEQAVLDALRGRVAQTAAAGAAIETSFGCVANGDNTWQCTLDVWAPSPAPDPAAATAGGDEEGGDGGSQQAIAKVAADGTIDPADVTCIAPG